MDSDHLLMAYADGELDEAMAAEAERRIASDPLARARVALYRETSSLLRSAYGDSHYAPTAPAVPAASVRIRLSRRRATLAVAASVAAGVAGFGLGRILPGAGGSDLLGEVAEYHAVISRETAHLAELPAARSDEAMAWLGARIARKLIVPDLESASLRFAGARLLVIDGEPVADLLYVREHGTAVALCIARMAGGARPIRLARRNGLQLATWQDGGYAYVVVGDLDDRTARDIAERAAVQLRV